MTIYVYGLFAPDDAEPKYIGRAADPASRLIEHRSKSAAHRVRDWVASLGQSPTLKVLRECANEQEARIAERAAIAETRLRGIDLLNSTWGGERARVRKEQQPPGFGARVRRRRLALRMSIADLAASAQIDKPRVSRIENDHRGPSAWGLIRLARALQTTAEWLVTGEGPESLSRSA